MTEGEHTTVHKSNFQNHWLSDFILFRSYLLKLLENTEIACSELTPGSLEYRYLIQ